MKNYSNNILFLENEASNKDWSRESVEYIKGFVSSTGCAVFNCTTHSYYPTNDKAKKQDNILFLYKDIK